MWSSFFASNSKMFQTLEKNGVISKSGDIFRSRLKGKRFKKQLGKIVFCLSLMAILCYLYYFFSKWRSFRKCPIWDTLYISIVKLFIKNFNNKKYKNLWDKEFTFLSLLPTEKFVPKCFQSLRDILKGIFFVYAYNPIRLFWNVDILFQAKYPSSTTAVIHKMEPDSDSESIGDLPLNLVATQMAETETH